MTAEASAESVRVLDDADLQRYELWIGDRLAATIEYRARPGERWLIHTVVGDEFAGRGLGSRLVAWAIDDIRERGSKLVPVCPFVRSYLRRHPEHGDLVDPAWANRR